MMFVLLLTVGRIFVQVTNNNMKKNGFTFIEILVVVTIIAILTTIGTVSYSAVSRRSRDAKRLADLEQIRAALELCRTEEGTYPSDDIITDNEIVCSGNTYLSPVPDDPKNTGIYVYDYNYIGATQYTVCANLETPSQCVTGATNPCCLANP